MEIRLSKIKGTVAGSSFVILLAVYLFLGGAAAIKVAIHETRCTNYLDQIAAKQDLNAVTAMDVNLNTRGMGFLTHFFLKLVYPQKSTVAKAMQNEQDIVTLIGQVKKEFRSSADASLALLGFTLFFLMAATAGGKVSGPELNQRKIYALLCVELIFFALGVSLPVLTAVVKGEHNLVGGFFLETSSKGIISTIVTLVKSDDWIIAVLLTGFSICIPIFKGTATLAVCLGHSDAKRRRVASFLDKIGKWSLTDVLVAAVILGCFSLNAIQEDSGGIVAVPRFALAYFIGYCILAGRSSYLLKNAVKAPASPRGPGLSRRAGTLIIASSIVAGALFGYFIFDNFPLINDLGDVAVVKLVRSHTELLKAKVRVDRKSPATIHFQVPFRGALTVEVEARSGSQLTVNVIRAPEDQSAGAKPAAGTPLAGFFSGDTWNYQHKDKVYSGNYDLTIRDISSGDEVGGVSVAYHITLDP